MMCPVYSNIKGDLIKRAHTKSIESSFAVAYLAYESQFAVIEAKRYIVMSFCRILKRMLDLTRPKVRKWGMMSLALCSFTYTACVSDTHAVYEPKSLWLKGVFRSKSVSSQ